MHYRFWFFLSFLFLIGFIQADDDMILTGDISQESIEEPFEDKKQLKGGPVRVEFSSNGIGKARLSKHHLKNQSLHYSAFEANATGIFYYQKEPKEAAFLTVGYEYVDLNWRQNPYFSKKDFNNLNVALGGATKRFNKFLWRGQILANLNLEHLNLNEYLTWDLLLWGRYTYNEKVNLHFGAYSWLGMKVNRVIPILGFDWRINSKWKLNAVFPVNLSLVYKMNDSWTLAFAARGISSRNRVGNHENLKKAIYEYRSVGAEVNLRYKNEDWFPVEANLHVGCDVGGCLRISNRHHDHSRNYHIGMAPYVGGELTFRP